MADSQGNAEGFYLAKLYEALSKAQGEIANPAFDSINPHFRNKYASLAAIRNAITPALTKHGISVSQDVSMSNGVVSCTTRVMHSSGGEVSYGPLSIPVTKPDAQGVGSAITYARRYQLQAVFNIVGDDDDDANIAIRDVNAFINKKQQDDIVNALSEVGGDMAGFLRLMKAETIEDIPSSKYQYAMQCIESKRKSINAINNT